MQARERTSLVVVAAVLGAASLYYVYDGLNGAFGSRYDNIAKLSATLTEKQQQTDRALRVRRNLKTWQERALPAEVDRARTLYKNWLLSLAADSRLENTAVNLPERIVGAKGAEFETLTFTVKGHGTWDQAATFLYGFYAAGHLHQIQNLTLAPLEGSDKLDITVGVEATSMKSARRADLTTLVGDRLAWSDAAHYSEILGKRNLFAPYSPPIVRTPPRTGGGPPPPPRFEEAEYAFLTGIIEVQGEREAWIKVRSTGELLKLRQGAAVKIGRFNATIASIDLRTVGIETDGQTRRVRLGERLQPATE